MAPQLPFDGIEFAENPEPRCPCVLLLDTSVSMAGKPIEELNLGLTAYFDELMADSVAAKRVEVAVVSFGGTADVVLDFSLVSGLQSPQLEAGGITPMGEAISIGLALLERRKSLYRLNGIPYYRPWVFLITDGGPTDEWRTAAEMVHEGVNTNGFLFFSVGVQGANFDVLRQLSPSDPLELKGLRFRDLFQWLSASQRSVSRSRLGQGIELKSPITLEGWGVIPT